MCHLFKAGKYAPYSIQIPVIAKHQNAVGIKASLIYLANQIVSLFQHELQGLISKQSLGLKITS